MQLRPRLASLSIPTKVNLLITVFVVIIAALIFIGYAGMEVLSGARAYVGGEGLWSKSQKHAVYYLTKYAHSRDEADYDAYLRAIAVPLGDKKARLELEKPAPDYALVYRGFAEGRNHPEDLWILARFFRWFRHIPYVDRAVVIWTEADGLIATMIERAEALRRGSATDRLSAAQVGALLAEVEALDKRLTVLEDEFSFTLGAAARWAKRVLATTMLVAALIFVATGVCMGLLFSKHLRQELFALTDGAIRVSRGDLEHRIPVVSDDEVGMLTRTFNRMTDELATSRAEIEQLNADLERRVIERTAQLEAANKELEAFSYSVSHDLRAPLRGIDGFSQALLEEYGGHLDETGQRYLARVRAGSRHMAQLIDDLLSLSRVTRSEIRHVRVDLSALARALAVELQRTQPDRPVTFEIEPGLTVHGDPGLLRVAMENLLGNSWKFTRKHPEARIEVRSTDHDGQRTFFVRDDGAGFDMAYADKLFHPFQRLHSAEEFEGTGIGLATVQRIVHRHGGRVWGEGALEKGATFYFTL
jgi:two-component system, sensor histidine kinase